MATAPAVGGIAVEVEGLVGDAVAGIVELVADLDRGEARAAVAVHAAVAAVGVARAAVAEGVVPAAEEVRVEVAAGDQQARDPGQHARPPPSPARRAWHGGQTGHGDAVPDGIR
jgi:hypothetical protein